MVAVGRRIYLDEDVDVAIAPRLNAVGVDAITTLDEEMCASPDAIQLAYATSLGRIIFTHNFVDFNDLCEEWWKKGQVHSGIIYSPRAKPHLITQWIVAGLELYDDLTSLIIRVPPADFA